MDTNRCLLTVKAKLFNLTEQSANRETRKKAKIIRTNLLKIIHVAAQSKIYLHLENNFINKCITDFQLLTNCREVK